MEASTLNPAPPVAGSPLHVRRLLWLCSDERLLALVRAGSDPAFEALVGRYRARLLAFCTQSLRSESDAEDVLQETFIAALSAIRSDTRPVELKPWLYCIARNRCLNHWRSTTSRRAAGFDENASDDTLAARPADDGISAAERVARKEEFRLLVTDIGELPENQRSALLLRELHGLSYDQIADVLGVSVSSVKSLLVRARGSLVESSEARGIPCDDARTALTEAAEGLARVSAPVRSHVKRCDDCRAFRGHLRRSTKLVAAMSPIGPLFTLKALLLTKLGAGAGGGAGTAGGAGVATTVGATTGLGVATKAVFGAATIAALVTGVGDVERQVRDRAPSTTAAPQAELAPHPSIGRTRPLRADPLTPSAPPAAVDGEGSATPGPAVDIQSSSPEPAAPQSAPGPPVDPSESLRRAPATSMRGRPSPGLDGGRRTRPAPPPSAEDRSTVVEPPAPTQPQPPPAEPQAQPLEPQAQPLEPPVSVKDVPPVSGEPPSGSPGQPSAR